MTWLLKGGKGWTMLWGLWLLRGLNKLAPQLNCLSAAEKRLKPRIGYDIIRTQHKPGHDFHLLDQFRFKDTVENGLKILPRLLYTQDTILTTDANASAVARASLLPLAMMCLALLNAQTFKAYSRVRDLDNTIFWQKTAQECVRWPHLPHEHYVSSQKQT